MRQTDHMCPPALSRDRADRVRLVDLGAHEGMLEGKHEIDFAERSPAGAGPPP